MATQHVSRRTATPATVAAVTSHRQPYDEPIPGTDVKGNATVTNLKTPIYKPAEPTNKPVTTANKPAPTADAPRVKKAAAVKLEEVEFGEIKPAAPDTFARKKNDIPEGHPLLEAFRKSYAAKAGIDVEDRGNPDALTKIIRRIAAQEGKGVSVKRPRDGVVSFLAQDRKTVVRKKPAAGNSAAAGE